jgi:septum formation protein
LRLRPLGTAEIERYVAAEQPLDCAGSYQIEALGIALFAAVQCDDHTAITGLPLLRLAQELRALGLLVP